MSVEGSLCHDCKTCTVCAFHGLDGSVTERCWRCQRVNAITTLTPEQEEMRKILACGLATLNELLVVHEDKIDAFFNPLIEEHLAAGRLQNAYDVVQAMPEYKGKQLARRRLLQWWVTEKEEGQVTLSMSDPAGLVLANKILNIN